MSEEKKYKSEKQITIKDIEDMYKNISNIILKHGQDRVGKKDEEKKGK